MNSVECIECSALVDEDDAQSFAPQDEDQNPEYWRCLRCQRNEDEQAIRTLKDVVNQMTLELAKAIAERDEAVRKYGTAVAVANRTMDALERSTNQTGVAIAALKVSA